MRERRVRAVISQDIGGFIADQRGFDQDQEGVRRLSIKIANSRKGRMLERVARRVAGFEKDVAAL